MNEIRTYWLSFCDVNKPKGQQFLGVSVVDVTAYDASMEKARLILSHPQHQPGAEWIASAIRKAWETGCNPGGQVGSAELPQDDPDTKKCPRNRLMSKSELEELGLI